MKLTIIAATGGVRRQLLEQAIAAGHDMTAAVRGLLMRYVLSHVASAALGKVNADLAVMEDVLRDSGLDWTVLRPPRMTDKPFTGRYRTAFGQNLRGGLSVPRADVAHFMLRVLDQPQTIGQVIGIAS